MKILIVEDDAASRKILEALVTKYGHEAVTAENGNTAWEILKKPKAPQIVILDWIMPGMDGEALCHLVRKQETRIPPYILMLTIKGEKDDIVRGLDAGANDYLSKPYDAGELNARINAGIRMLQLEKELAKRIDDLELNEKKIQTLLAEKELLLFEVHHRIKNNMNTVINLLDLQADAVPDTVAATVLRNAIGRLKTMSILYDKLYRSDDLNSMSVQKYLPPLIEEIISVFPNKDNIKLDIEIDDYILDIPKLSSLGMILNELVCNSMKYAFSGKRTGTITLISYAKGKKATVIFEDNGCGLPAEIHLDAPESFGLKLVAGITQQIGGTIKVNSEKGTRYILEFGI